MTFAQLIGILQNGYKIGVDDGYLFTDKTIKEYKKDKILDSILIDFNEVLEKYNIFEN